MTKRYTGGVVSSSLPTVNAAGASGVFNLSQQADAQTKNNWPPFKVEKSLRFRRASSAYLTRTPSASSNKTTWTWSGWVKKGLIGGYQNLFAAGSPTNTAISFHNATDSYGIDFGIYSSGYIGRKLTSVLYRDCSSWYHIVCVCDTTNATAADRMKIYVNGTRVTNFSVSTDPSQNYNSDVNGTTAHWIGQSAGSDFLDGYLSEVNFVDGLALTPSSFGGTDKDGNWSPIAYTGTYGQNGFYLNFKDATSTSTIGYDYSGNGNNWTASGFNVTTANTSYDSMIDVPSDQAGANTRGNYCTLNPLEYAGSGFTSITNGNLDATFNGYYWTAACGTLAIPNTGKWYYEFTGSGWSTSSNWPNVFCGFLKAGVRLATDPSDTPNSALCGIYIRNDSNAIRFYDFANNPFSTSPTLSASDGGDGTYMIAIDFDNNKLYLGVNGTWYQSGDPNAGTNGLSITNPGEYVRPMYMMNPAAGGTLTSYLNFGQRPFAYTPPTGYKTLNTYNLPEPAIKSPNKHFDITSYTGANTSQTITNAGGFQPSFVWVKSRNLAYYHTLEDDIRGAGTRLFTNLTDGESNDGILTSFNSNGFSLGNNSGEGINNAAANYVAYQWKGATSNTTNTNGSVSAITRVNSTAGFSVSVFTTPTSGTFTVGHGLPATPSLIVFKSRGSGNWIVQHTSTGSQYTLLNSVSAATTDSTVWNSAATSTVVNFGTGFSGYSGSSAVMYCWTPIAGYSAFGSYTGNGSSDGPFIYCGFKPKFIIIKCSSSTDGGNAQWLMYDTARNPTNVNNTRFWADSSAAEYSYSGGSGGYNYDLLSNGFKVRTGDASYGSNTSGYTYIYAAFAEVPFKYSRSR